MAYLGLQLRLGTHFVPDLSSRTVCSPCTSDVVEASLHTGIAMPQLVRNISVRLLPVLLAAAVHAAPIGLGAFSSSATLIDFDNLAGGSCNLCGLSTTNQYQFQGVVFNNPTYPGQETIDSNLTALMPNSSGPNMLFVYQGGLLSQPAAAPFQLLFSSGVAKVGFDFGSSAYAFLQLQAYDAGGNLIELDNFTGNSAPIGLAGFAGIQSTVPIVRLDVSYHPNNDPARTFNFSIDNLRFETAAPEPASIILMSAGLAGMVLLRSRRRTSKSS